MISEELKATILRYYYAENWKIGTIRRQLKLHASVIQRVLRQEGVSAQKILPGPSRLTPFLPFILEILNKYPTLSSVRLYDMVYQRGYRGSLSHFRHLMLMHKPKPIAEAYLRLKTLPGEQCQVDWGSFGTIEIGRAKRPLSAFVMVLSYSRKIFLRFYLNQRMGFFLQAHQAAFEAFSGVPRVALYDNCKTAVLERQGNTILFNPNLTAFAAHYRFDVRPVAVARGNEKGRVERSIRYVRENFFIGRTWKSLDDLNAQAQIWCEGVAADRPCAEDPSESVRTIFKEEKPFLLALPDNPFETEEREAVRVGKTPYLKFDLNSYSVPHNQVRQTLTVLATQDQVRIVNGTEVVATHQRSYDRGKTIEDPVHIQRLIDFKRKARHHNAQNSLLNVAPSSAELLKQIGQRGHSIRSAMKQLMLLLENYGTSDLERAIKEALDRNVPSATSVRINLEKYREAKKLSTAIHLNLSSKNRAVNQTVKPHSLQTYDELNQKECHDD